MPLMLYENCYILIEISLKFFTHGSAKEKPAFRLLKPVMA